MLRCFKPIWVMLLGALLLHGRQTSAQAEPSAVDDRPFSVVLLPDTQYYSLRFPERYDAQTEWVRAQAAERNIRFVIHLGDIVHLNTNREWKNANRAMSILDGHVPYSMVPGNHDMPFRAGRLFRNTGRFNRLFGSWRYEDEPWYGGNLDGRNDNNFCFFSGGRHQYLVLSLEFAPSDFALNWANRTIAAHPNHRVIVATHAYLRRNGERYTSLDKQYGVSGNSGEAMWHKLLCHHRNIFMVVCGHAAGVAYRQSEGLRGNLVHELLTNYQQLENGGNGWLRILEFAPRENIIRVTAHSPVLGQTNLHPRQTFSIPHRMVWQSGRPPEPVLTP